jgi:hypothetical protein
MPAVASTSASSSMGTSSFSTKALCSPVSRPPGPPSCSRRGRGLERRAAEDGAPARSAPNARQPAPSHHRAPRARPHKALRGPISRDGRAFAAGYQAGCAGRSPPGHSSSSHDSRYGPIADPVTSRSSRRPARQQVPTRWLHRRRQRDRHESSLLDESSTSFQADSSLEPPGPGRAIIRSGCRQRRA